MLYFCLENDGLTYQESTPGFGLSSMMERVRELGGEAAIGPSYTKEGEARGCLVTLRVPLGREE